MMTSARPRSRALTRQRRTLRWATQCQPLSVLLTLDRLFLLLVPGKKREMRHTVLVRVHPPKVAWAASRMSDAADRLDFKVAELKRLGRRAEGEAVAWDALEAEAEVAGGVPLAAGNRPLQPLHSEHAGRPHWPAMRLPGRRPMLKANRTLLRPKVSSFPAPRLASGLRPAPTRCSIHRPFPRRHQERQTLCLCPPSKQPIRRR